MYQRRLYIVVVLFVALMLGCAPLQRQDVLTPTPGEREGLQETLPQSALTTSPVSPRPAPRTVEAVALPLTPVVTAERVLPYSWSPSGTVLAFWTWTAEEVQADHLYPPGHLHFYDAATGVVCTSPVDVTYPHFTSTLMWTPGEEAILLSQEQRLIRLAPCRDESPRAIENLPEPVVTLGAVPGNRLLLRTSTDDFTVIEVPTHATTLVLVGANDYLYNWETRALEQLPGQVIGGVFSPDGNHIAISDGAGTKLISLLTGNVEAEVAWTSQPGEGTPAPDIWLSDRELLVGEDVIGGPLIVTIDGEVVQVTDELFGFDCSERSCETLAVRSADTATYHLLVQAPGGAPEVQGPWLLYHSESGQVENLGQLVDPRFSLDGHWLAALQDMNGQEASAVWLRSTDPPGSEPLAFGPVRQYGFLNWSPDSNNLALHLEDGLAVLHWEGGWDLLARWLTAGYEPIAALWSPDNQYLAIQASSTQGGENALFVAPVTRIE